MDYISNQAPQIQEMLEVIGVASIDELFVGIPEILRKVRPSVDDGLSECEGLAYMESLSKKNSFDKYLVFLGAGAYEHYVPSIVNAICSKSEFLTAYTPYQPEASQGMLQVVFEFQSAISALTGLDVANASVYDGASACSEALLMALRVNKERSKILIAESLNPHYREVVNLYLQSHQMELINIPLTSEGTIDTVFIRENTNESVAAILIQSPNFFGQIEDVQPLFSEAKAQGIVSILCSNPLSYALFLSAGELGADIAVGDCQPLGLPLNFGGPYAGYISCRKELIRQLPGRIVGETVDTLGRKGYVLTLQAREQHIRREKATSNICTNQALAALATLVTLSWYGKEGLLKLALTNYQRTSYLRSQLSKIPGISIVGTSAHFNEIVVEWMCPMQQVFDQFRLNGIVPGVDLSHYFPSIGSRLLVAVTEMKSLQNINEYVRVAADLMKGVS